MAKERDGIVSSLARREKEGGLGIPEMRGLKVDLENNLGPASHDGFLHVEVGRLGVVSVGNPTAVLHSGALGVVGHLALLLFALSEVTGEVDGWFGGRRCSGEV